MTTDDRGPAPQWPDASEWPSDDVPPIEVARFCRDRMGWIVFPCAGPADVRAYAQSLALKAAAEYALESTGSVEGEVPDDVSIDIWDDAREQAEATLGRPIGYIYKAWSAKVDVAADVTDQMLREAWEPLESSHGPRARADERGVAILPNRSSQGLPVCLVDVDPRSGGDVDGPWGMQLAGPKASTPSGGVHTLVLSTGKETASADLGPGVDVVAGGGTTIPVPSGSATPGRRWLRHEQPAVAPEELRRRGRKRAPKAPQVEREPGDDWDEDGGHGATIVSSPVGDGERNRLAGVLIGILARPRACPEDFVRAALELLAEDMAGRDAPSPEVRAESARWQQLLTRGPRDERFAAEFLECWLHVRDTSRKRMRTPPAKFVASVWRVCDRREGGRAGAEDFSVGAPVSPWPTTAWGPRPEPPAAPAPDVGGVPPDPPADHCAAAENDEAPPDVPYPPPPDEVAQAAVAASKAPTVVQATWRGGVDPRLFAPTIGEDYTREHLQRDLLREPIRIDAVMPAVDFRTGVHSTSPDLLTPPVMFGWGPHMALAKGGLSPGDFVAVGASSAGAGKTTYLAWLLNGLTLQTACRMLDVPGYESCPLVLPIWASEMPKQNEIYARLLTSYLGFHRAVIDAGPRAAEAPGVLAAASVLSMTGPQYVERAREMEDDHGNKPVFPLAYARHRLLRRIDLGKLPRHSRRDGVTIHHRSGPDLVDHLADVVDLRRYELAEAAGVRPDQVLPIVVADPVQRFAGGGSSQRDAIDAVLGALNDVLCRELGCAVFVTSDTTKGAAKNITLDHFLSAEAPGLMADTFAGTQGIIHHASDVIAVHPEQRESVSVADQEDPRRRIRPGCYRMWARLLRSRGGGESPLTFPYEWDRALGRLDPREPMPLRAPPEQTDRRGGERGRGNDHGRPEPRPFVPNGVRLPPLRGRREELQD